MLLSRPILRPGLIPDDNGLVGVGGRLTVPLVLEMYAEGVFPWTGRHPIPWFSPDPRCILRPEDFRARRSLRKVARAGGFRVAFDTRFDEVMQACASVPRPGQDGTWITPNMFRVYGELHDLGFCHSVEVIADDGALVGGLYGVSLGAAFYGESMFHRRRDMSKIALWALCDCLRERDFELVDCQQETEHLVSLGAVAVPRQDFLERLRSALSAKSQQGHWCDWTWAPAGAGDEGTAR